MPNKTNTPQPKVHHYIRTILASLFGSLALSLILASILVVWLNRTLTDTNTYVQAVAPLVSKPDIQNFVAQKATDQLTNINQDDHGDQGNQNNQTNQGEHDDQNTRTADLASMLLPPEAVAGKTPEQLNAAVKTVVYGDILEIVKSPDFAVLWKNTNQTAHAQLITQLKSNSKEVSLDLSPAVQGAVALLKTSKLSPISDKISVSPDAGKLNLKGGGIDKAHTYYDLFQKATLAIVAATIIAIGLAVWISVHHAKTLRRILTGTGVTALILALVLQAPSIVKFNGADAAQQKAAVAIAKTLFHNLQLAAIIIAAVCLGLAIGSKIYAKLHKRTA